MYAIEFQSAIENGMIEVPQVYRDQLGKRVRVIVLVEDSAESHDSQEPPMQNYIEHLMDNRKTIKGFTPLSREEIYAEREWKQDLR